MRPSSRFRCFVASATSSLDASGWPSRALATAAAVFGPQMPSGVTPTRSEEHTSELQSLMRISYAVFCLKQKNSRETRKIHELLLHGNQHGLTNSTAPLLPHVTTRDPI